MSAALRLCELFEREPCPGEEPCAFCAAQGIMPLTDGLENRLREFTRKTVIDRDNDTIEGDVGL